MQDSEERPSRRAACEPTARDTLSRWNGAAPHSDRQSLDLAPPELDVLHVQALGDRASFLQHL